MLLTGSRDKEVSEFRSLLQTVFSCLKSVLYCMVAFHTNRGLQAPVRGVLFPSNVVHYANLMRGASVIVVSIAHLECRVGGVLPSQLSFPVKTWSVRSGDVRIVSRLMTFGLPALAFYKAVPHPSVDMREQFADLFTVLQVGA